MSHRHQSLFMLLGFSFDLGDYSQQKCFTTTSHILYCCTCQRSLKVVCCVRRGKGIGWGMVLYRGGHGGITWPVCKIDWWTMTAKTYLRFVGMAMVMHVWCIYFPTNGILEAFRHGEFRSRMPWFRFQIIEISGMKKKNKILIRTVCSCVWLHHLNSFSCDVLRCNKLDVQSNELKISTAISHFGSHCAVLKNLVSRRKILVSNDSKFQFCYITVLWALIM